MGTPVETGIDGLTCMFPTAADIAALGDGIQERLGTLGVIAARSACIRALCPVCRGLCLAPGIPAAADRHKNTCGTEHSRKKSSPHVSSPPGIFTFLNNMMPGSEGHVFHACVKKHDFVTRQT